MFSTNYQEVNDIIPAGVYEAMITSAKEDGKITIGLEIRKDVDQDCKGRGFTHWMYKLREPGDIDKQIDSYSYSQIMRIAKSARLPEGNAVQHAARQFLPHRIAGGNELQVHRHVAAAHHAETCRVPLHKPEVPDRAAAGFQQLRRQALGLVFHIAAAHGARGAAAFKHRHHGPGSPGRGAAGGKDAHQLHRPSRLQGVDRLPPEFPHISRPPLSRCPK